MAKDYVNLVDWPTRIGFSQAVVTRLGDVQYVSVSGTSAKEPANITGQCERIWLTVSEILAYLGGSLADIVRVRTYATNVDFLESTRNARIRALGSAPYPAHSFVAVSGLAHPSMLVEMEFDAII